MAAQKFKTDLVVQALLKLAQLNTSRALALNGTGEVVASATTDAELGHLSGVTGGIQGQIDDKIDLTEKGAANGVATLGANQKIPSSQIPAIAITEVFVVADITARDALVVGPDDGEVQEGDVAIVTDASADINVNAGGASYIYDGTSWQRLITPDDAVFSVNGETGVVVLDTDNIGEGVTNLYFTTVRAQDAAGAAVIGSGIVPLAYDGVGKEISASLDIEAATAEATSNDADLLIIYSNANSANRKMTRGDFLEGLDIGQSPGDISETSFDFINNQAAAADITGLAFAAGVVRSFSAQVSISRGTLHEVYELKGVQLDGGFTMSQVSVGDETAVEFSITTAGQVQYTSTDAVDGGTIKFRATTLSV